MFLILKHDVSVHERTILHGTCYIMSQYGLYYLGGSYASVQDQRAQERRGNIILFMYFNYHDFIYIAKFKDLYLLDYEPSGVVSIIKICINCNSVSIDEFVEHLNGGGTIDTFLGQRNYKSMFTAGI